MKRVPLLFDLSELFAIMSSEHLYCKRFGQERPDVVLSIEERIRRDEVKKAQRHEAKLDL